MLTILIKQSLKVLTSLLKEYRTAPQLHNHSGGVFKFAVYIILLQHFKRIIPRVQLLIILDSFFQNYCNIQSQKTEASNFIGSTHMCQNQ